MITTNNPRFYSELPVNKMSVSDLVADRSLFYEVPEDWHVLIADIKNSTQAIKNGKHNEVNLVATGSIIAVLNIVYSEKINVPFFFGGDGATILVPSKYLKSAMSALEKHRENTLKNFGFELKIGHISVEEIYRDKIELKIAKAEINDIFNIPVVLGNGLQYAENLIKNEDPLKKENFRIDQFPLNLNGMECKWDKIRPPEESQEVVSLIVTGCGDQDPSKIFSEVLKAIDEIYGSQLRRKPISIKRLGLKAGFQKINSEMRAKLGRFDGSYFLKNLVKVNFGNFYLKNSKAGKRYLQKLVELTDTLTIDGRINTVITGTSDQRISLISFLDHLEGSNKIKYGLYVSQESVMSCYVRDMGTNDHIHFVDGADGGYTRAANSLKKKAALTK
jgi:hypothetical protein